MPLKRNRKTKIVATLGPTSATPEIIEELFKTGVDVFRLNFSHGVHSDHEEKVKIIREIEKRLKKPIGIFADMQGPKLRLGVFENDSIDIKKGDKITLDSNPEAGNNTRINLPHPEIIAALQIGSDILLDDGKVHLKVIGKTENAIDTEVISGKNLSNRKGVNLPDVLLEVSSLTKKDRIDLEAALEMGVDWIALSFVQRPKDIDEARKLINGRAQIIAKIEKPSAIECFDKIVEKADAIMLARGDLGVEVPAENVPSIQKHVVRVCRQAGKPLIIATQMLESMISCPRPTRAEASDVATAIYDGADAVMLSAETASGEYPLEAVSMMDKIAVKVEKDDLYRKIMDAEHPHPNETSSDAITASSAHVAINVSAAAIVNYTTSGSTARRTARERPSVGIFCLTADKRVARRMQLLYGVYSVHTDDVESFSEMVSKACSLALEHGIVEKGQNLVITAGVPFKTPGSTNILHVAKVK